MLSVGDESINETLKQTMKLNDMTYYKAELVEIELQLIQID